MVLVVADRTVTVGASLSDLCPNKHVNFAALLTLSMNKLFCRNARSASFWGLEMSYNSAELKNWS